MCLSGCGCACTCGSVGRGGGRKKDNMIKQIGYSVNVWGIWVKDTKGSLYSSPNFPVRLKLTQDTFKNSVRHLSGTAPPCPTCHLSRPPVLFDHPHQHQKLSYHLPNSCLFCSLPPNVSSMELCLVPAPCPPPSSVPGTQ